MSKKTKHCHTQEYEIKSHYNIKSLAAVSLASRDREWHRNTLKHLKTKILK